MKTDMSILCYSPLNQNIIIRNQFDTKDETDTNCLVN